MLDPVPQESVESKTMVQIYARKKALAGAASVLLNGAERLKTSQNEIARNRATPDFHIELLRLRQNWRLKKVSNTIIGDLSYRTAGSKYAQTGMFEVTKAEEEDKPNSPPNSPLPTGQTSASKSNSALRVSVPSELQGVAYIEVICQKGCSAVFVSKVFSEISHLFRSRGFVQCKHKFAGFGPANIKSRCALAAEIRSRTERALL